MGMDIDEPRRDRQTVARDSFESLALGEIADDRDAAGDDPDVGRVRRGPRAVVNPGTLEYSLYQKAFNLAPAGKQKTNGAIAQGGLFQMETSDKANSGGMSVREAGKRGGDRVKAKYGSEFYEAIGRKGGEATKSKYGPTFYEEIGQKGGQKVKRAATETAK